MRWLLASLVVLSACADGGPTAPLNRNFRLAIGETAHIQGTALDLTFKRVSEDTRCPMGALCIVAGNARIEIEATFNGDPTQLMLSAAPDPDSPGTTNEGFVGGFRVKFADLQPAPRINAAIDEKDYRATLMIEAANCPIEMLCSQLRAH